MIVVDSSSLAKFILREEGWEKIEAILAEDRAVTLELALTEVLNAIWRHAVLLGSFPLDVAREKIEVLVELVESGVLEVVEQRGHLRDAFEIAATQKVTVYDALFIALAASTRATLVASDARQAEVAESLGVNVKLVV